MASQSVEQRVQTLERHVETLKTLPDRVGKLELEFRTGFSALRKSIDELRAQMLVLHEDVLARFALLDEHLGRTSPARRRAPKTDSTKNG
jgi:hypothetical protein